MSFRGFQIDSSGRLRIKNAGIVLAGSGDPCCCVGAPTVIWYAIFPCDDFAGITGDICCDGNCYWITAVRYCELLQDAIDNGDIPSSCVTAPDGDGLCDLNFAPDTRDSSLCDLNTPDYFVVWNNLTQSCYRLYIRKPFGVTITPCRTASTADYSTVPTGGIDGTNAVTYVGVDCCDSPCPCDGSGNPDPPQDPTPPATVDGRCGCVNGSDYVTATVAVSKCNCFEASAGGVYVKYSNAPSGTYDLPAVAACLFSKSIAFFRTQFSDSGCTTTSGLFPTSTQFVQLAVSLNSTSMSANFFSTGDEGLRFFEDDGTGSANCAGGTSGANLYTTCGNTVIPLQTNIAATGGVITAHFRA